MLGYIRLTTRDFIQGLQRWELWSHLAWNEIRKKYRRSTLGPIWSSINFGIFTTGIGLLYANLFQQDLTIFLPHLMLGMIIWNILSQVMMEGCHLFIGNKGYIQEVNIPLSAFLLLLMWRNMIIFVFDFLVFVVAALLLSISLEFSWLLSFIGLILILINALWLGTLLAVIATRYHDISEVMGSAMRVIFFLTPIIWMPGTGKFEFVLNANPFYHLIEIFRAQIVGGIASPTSWIVVVVITVVGWTITSIVYGKYKNRISFWI
ncbi:ABC transporter permease [Pseudomonadota bacterium]